MRKAARPPKKVVKKPTPVAKKVVMSKRVKKVSTLDKKITKNAVKRKNIAKNNTKRTENGNKSVKAKKLKRLGRPPKYETVAELEKLIEAYFKSCWEQKIDMFGNPLFIKDAKGKKTKKKVMVQMRPYTITGLALSLGTTRDVLIDYEEKTEFSNTIKRAKQMCHNYAEESLFMGRNPTGAIFNLKNNYAWKDKTELDTKHTGDLIVKTVSYQDIIPNV